ncbi:MAG: SHOCT domain-containing protein [Sulfuricurvum sp.]|nr:SHOCT domain-containing protein [Sulfuricurvum sp.]
MDNFFMMFWMGGLLFTIAIFALWIWALVDIVKSEFKDVGIKVIWFVFVFFIPFLGFVLYAILGKSTKIVQSGSDSNQKYDDLERIKQLYDNGALSEAEFESEKKKIMERN